jgi:hypothetical protein
MLQVPEVTPNFLQILGEQNLTIIFDCENPDKYLGDISMIGLSKEEKKLAKKKPFVVTKGFKVLVLFEGRQYFFKIPKGYRWNGANVPSFAWILIGQRTDPRFKLASCIHDYMCEHHKVVDYNRYLSTLIFVTCCQHFGDFPAWKLFAMKHSIDNYQKVLGKDEEGKRWKP